MRLQSINHVLFLFACSTRYIKSYLRDPILESHLMRVPNTIRSHLVCVFQSIHHVLFAFLIDESSLICAFWNRARRNTALPAVVPHCACPLRRDHQVPGPGDKWVQGSQRRDRRGQVWQSSELPSQCIYITILDIFIYTYICLYI